MFEEAVCFRGKLYIAMNFYHKAELDFKSIIAASPAPSFLSFVGLADCQRFQGKLERALALYARALDALPAKDSRDLAHRQDIELKVAICLYQLERFGESHGLLEGLAKS
jgi:tetratricopeptide (TPR) repeat protein